MRTHVEIIIIALLSLIVVLAMFFPAVFQGTRSIQWDALDLHYPHLAFASRSVQAGTIPLWEPHIFCGYPFIGYLQSGAFYPINLITALFHVITPRIVIFLTVLSYLLAFSGLWYLVRSLGLSHPASALAAITWAFSGQLLGHASHLGIIQMYALFPWVLLISMRSWQNGNSKFVALGGILLGWSCLAGHFQTALYCSVFWLTWIALGVLIDPGSLRIRLLRSVRLILLGSAVIVFATGIQLFATADLALQSNRSNLSVSLAESESFKLASLNTLLYPNRFGGIIGPYTGPWDRTNQQCYAGFFTPLLWVAGWLSGIFRVNRKAPPVRGYTKGQRINNPGFSWQFYIFLIGWVSIGFLFSLGSLTSVHDWMTSILPGWDLVRTPAAILPLVFLALSIMAAFGLDWITSIKPGHVSTIIRYCLPVITMVHLIILYWNSDLMFGKQPTYTHFRQTAHREFLDRQYSENSSGFRIQEWDIREVMLTNEPSWKGWYCTGGRISGLHLRNLGRLLQLSQFKRDIPDILRVRYILVSPQPTATTVVSTNQIPTETLRWNPLAELRSVSPGILVNPDAQPLVFPVTSWKAASGTEDIVEELMKQDLHHTVILDEALDWPYAEPPLTWSFEPKRIGPHDIEFDYTLDQPALLVMGDTWTPDWLLSIDRIPATLLRANLALRAIPAPAGSHTVTLTYRPFSYLAGAFFWVISSGIMGFCLMLRGRR